MLLQNTAADRWPKAGRPSRRRWPPGWAAGGLSTRWSAILHSCSLVGWLESYQSWLRWRRHTIYTSFTPASAQLLLGFSPPRRRYSRRRRTPTLRYRTRRNRRPAVQERYTWCGTAWHTTSAAGQRPAGGGGGYGGEAAHAGGCCGRCLLSATFFPSSVVAPPDPPPPPPARHPTPGLIRLRIGWRGSVCVCVCARSGCQCA